MSTKATLRRLLSYLNISEFDSLVVHKLFSEIRLRDKIVKQPYFELFFMSVAMWLTAGAFFKTAYLYLLSCETGKSPVAWMAAGGVLFLFFMSITLLVKNIVFRRFVWGLSLGAQILFLYGVYSVSPSAAFICAVAVFLMLGRNEHYTFQQTSTVLTACTVLLAGALKTQGAQGLFWLTALTFPTGVFGTLYPLKDVYFQRASRVLIFFAPVVLFVLEIAGLRFVLPYEAYGAKFVFLFCAVLFFLFLKNEMTEKEQRFSMKILGAYFLGTILFPASAAGCCLILLTGWLADFITVFRAAAVLLSLSVVVFVLSLDISFFAATVVFAVTGIACLLLVRKMKGAV